MLKSPFVIALCSLPLLAVLEGCQRCEHPAGALPTAPDRECRVGVEVGADVAIWNCVDQKHVVSYVESTAFFGCSASEVEQVPCGELTPFEKKFEDGNVCDEISSPIPPEAYPR